MQGEWVDQVFLGIYTGRWKTIVSHSINIKHAYLLQIHLWSDRMLKATRLWWTHLPPEEGQGFSPQVCLAVHQAHSTYEVSLSVLQSYTIHSVVDNKCVPLVYILSGDKKGDTQNHTGSGVPSNLEHGFQSRVHHPIWVTQSPLYKSMCELLKSSRWLLTFISTGWVLVRHPPRGEGLAIPNSMISIHSTPHTQARSIICLL